MDIFDEEIIKFWKSLNDASVRYIIVGGYAANLHGFQRYTGDMDIWIDDSIENRKNLRTAFKNYSGIDYFMIETMEFVPGWTNFSLNNGMRLDIMIGMKGLEGNSFAECLQSAKKGEIDGVIVPFLHINHLIQNKKAVNRPKDQVDVIYLEKIKKILEEEAHNNQS